MAVSPNVVVDNDLVAAICPYLVTKPKEWIVTGRANYTFKIPPSYYPDGTTEESIFESFSYLKDKNRTVVPIKYLDPPANMQDFLVVSKDETFSIFISHHVKCANTLRDTLIAQETAEDFLSICLYVRDQVNAALFAYAFTQALHRRPEKELKAVELPSHVTTNPYYYLHGKVIREAKRKLLGFPGNNRPAIEVEMQYTATNLEEEQRTAYFREDIGLNLHHWHWHLVYPHDDDTYKLSGAPLPTCYKKGELNKIVNKDRRGELFYYMHQQMIARYNFERLSNRMARVRPLKDLQEPIAEGYYSKLIDLNSNQVWPARQPNTKIKSVTRELEQLNVDVDHIKRVTDRILSAIDAKSVYTGPDMENDALSKDKKNDSDDGKDKDKKKADNRRPLTPEDGIDILGNLVESTCISVNRDYYGDLHNMGHVALALIHDPDGRYKEGVSMMGSVETACRDPIFWRWHAHINDLFTAHKNSLDPYTEEELRFDGITINDINIKVEGCPQLNELRTFWEKDNIDISWGIDYGKGLDDGPLYATIRHLDHKPFKYIINVSNAGKVRDGTVRIFMAPKLDESYQRFAFFHQRHLFIELDRFVVTLNGGETTIERESCKSSVTIPWSQTFRAIGHTGVLEPGKGDPQAYCGCGWPQHLLIPRGTGEGFEADLFVMITDTQQDKVDGAAPPRKQHTEYCNKQLDKAKVGKELIKCGDSMSYCGLKDSKYPDKKPMGFPFDRRPRNIPSVKDRKVDLADFVKGIGNMETRPVTIRFTNEQSIYCQSKLLEKNPSDDVKKGANDQQKGPAQAETEPKGAQ